MTSGYSGYKTSLEKLFYYVLSGQVWWCNIKRFLSYSKNYICKLMQANLWHIPLPFALLNVEKWKVR